VIDVFVIVETRLYREGIARAVDDDDRLELVGTAEGLADAVTAIGSLELPPLIVLLDHAIPEGPAAVPRLRAACPDVRVVALAVREAEGDVIPWAEAGVAGFVPHSASLDDLLTAVVAVAAGGSPCSPQLAAVLLNRIVTLASERRSTPALRKLTPREREIALLLEEGLSNKEIAARLSIQVATVKHHVHSVLEKLHVRRRGEAASAVRAAHGI
jgi:DNA-binding NarL/FixJ family response regulator